MKDLLEAADQRVHGHDLNRVLYETREGIEGATVAYEIVLEGQTLDAFLEEHLPKLSDHYLAKKLPMLGNASVVIVLWEGEYAHLYSGAAFTRLVMERLGVDENGLRAEVVSLRKKAGMVPNPWPH